MPPQTGGVGREAMPGESGAVLVAGRYRIEGVLGEGGMGRVYAVVDELSGKPFALKRLTPGGPPAATALFQREYHTLVQLRHPCIVQALDYGLDAQGPYYTMERLEGRDLRTAAPLDWRASCEVLRDLASALALVHSRRLLHRDVNHKNVRYIEGQRARLLDFGALTSFGVATERVGMAPFMSPEAFHGQPLGPRSDLYALGGVGYWLLTGRLAYDARRSKDLPTLWQRTPPSPAALGVQLPLALDTLVMQLLSLEPLTRPGSAAEVIDRLAEIADLERGDPHQAARSYLANPRLVGRTRDLERMDRALRLGLRASSTLAQPTSARTGGFAPVPTRSTGRVPRVESAKGPARSDSVLWLAGPGGVGRSRLLYELVLQAKLQGARVAWVSAASTSGRPHSALRALIDDLVGHEPELTELQDAAQRAILEELMPETKTRSEPPVDAALGVAADHRVRLHSAMVDWLLAIGVQRGLVVVVDDVQRMDDDSATLLAALAARIDTGRVVLALSANTDAGAVPRSLGTVREAAKPVLLSGLSASATQELVSSLFGGATNSRRLASWAHKLGSGNPLHTMQLMEHLVDTGLARYDRGQWQLSEDPQAQELPARLKDVYAAKVGALSVDARDLGRALALHEGPVSIERVGDLFASQDQAQLFAALDELTSAGVVDRDARSYRLTHELLSGALSTGLTDEWRAAIHRRIGVALSARQPVELEERFEVAYHLLKGGDDEAGLQRLLDLVRHTDLVHAIGPRACEILERALELCTRAGHPPGDAVRIRVALVVGGSSFEPNLLAHVDAALDDLRRALGVEALDATDAMDAGPVRGEQLRLAMRRAQERNSVAPPAQQTVSPGEALGALCNVILNLIRVYASHYDIPALQRLLNTTRGIGGVSRVTELVHDNVLAVIDDLQGHQHKSHPRFLHIVTELDRMIDKAKPGTDTAPLRRWRNSLLTAVAASSLYLDPRETLRWADQAEAAAMFIPAWRIRQLAGMLLLDYPLIAQSQERLEALNTPLTHGWEQGGWFLANQGGLLTTLGEDAALKEALERLEEVASESEAYRSTLLLFRGHLCGLRGELELAERCYHSALQLDPQRIISATRYALGALARVQLASSRWAEALALCEEQALLAPGPEAQGVERNVLAATRALALAGLGRTAEGRALMDRALAHAPRCGALTHFDRLIDAGRLALLLKDAALFRRVAGESGAIARQSGFAGLLKRWSNLQKAGQSTGLEA